LHPVTFGSNHGQDHGQTHASGPIQYYYFQISFAFYEPIFLHASPETLRNVDNGRHATNVPDYMKLALICWTVVISQKKNGNK